MCLGRDVLLMRLCQIQVATVLIETKMCLHKWCAWEDMSCRWCCGKCKYKSQPFCLERKPVLEINADVIHQTLTHPFKTAGAVFRYKSKKSGWARCVFFWNNVPRRKHPADEAVASTCEWSVYPARSLKKQNSSPKETIMKLKCVMLCELLCCVADINSNKHPLYLWPRRHRQKPREVKEDTQGRQSNRYSLY